MIVMNDVHCEARHIEYYVCMFVCIHGTQHILFKLVSHEHIILKGDIYVYIYTHIHINSSYLVCRLKVVLCIVWQQASKKGGKKPKPFDINQFPAGFDTGM